MDEADSRFMIDKLKQELHVLWYEGWKDSNIIITVNYEGYCLLRRDASLSPFQFGDKEFNFCGAGLEFDGEQKESYKVRTAR